MTREIRSLIITILLAQPVFAADSITKEQIQQVIAATDAAARERNTPGIEKYLGENFEKKLDMRHGKWMASIKIRKDQYLALIDEGWKDIDEYDYRRDNTVIYIAADGLSGESYSTITETVVNNGERMVSKVREHARYTLEEGMPVITHISGHTLVGDTTPKVEQ